MKRVLAAVSMLCLVLGFQNCSQSSLQGSAEQASSQVAISVPSQNGESASQTVTYIEVPNISEDSGVAQKASELTPYRLVVSVNSGSIQLMDESNNVIEKRCLDSAQLQELQTILAGSSVCAVQASSAEVCAMKYTPGYASLYANEKRINLGEQRDSCGNGKKDLCGGLANVFQNYVSFLRSNWSEMNCQ